MSIEFIGMACALGLSAMGSAFGAGFAAQASVGAWKKCYANGKPAPFIMVAFSGAPLTQTIYGFLLMNFIRSAVASGADPALAMFTGIFAGLAIGLSAFFQGKVAAASADALGETGKGTANFFMHHRNGRALHARLQPPAVTVSARRNFIAAQQGSRCLFYICKHREGHRQVPFVRQKSESALPQASRYSRSAHRQTGFRRFAKLHLSYPSSHTFCRR